MRQFRFLHSRTVEEDYNWLLNSRELSSGVFKFFNDLLREYERKVDRKKPFPPIFLAFCSEEMWHACTYYIPSIKDSKGRSFVAFSGVCWESQDAATDRAILNWSFFNKCAELKFADHSFISRENLLTDSTTDLDFDRINKFFDDLIAEKTVETNITGLLDGHVESNVDTFLDFLIDGNLSNPVYFGPKSTEIQNILTRKTLKLSMLDLVYTQNKEEKQKENLKGGSHHKQLNAVLEEVEIVSASVSVDIHRQEGLLALLIKFFQKFLFKPKFHPVITVEINEMPTLFYTLDEVELEIGELKYIIRDTSSPATRLIQKDLRRVARLVEDKHKITMKQSSDTHFDYFKKKL